MQSMCCLDASGGPRKSENVLSSCSHFLVKDSFDDKQFHAETQNINSQRDDGIIDESFLYPPLLVVDLF